MRLLRENPVPLSTQALIFGLPALIAIAIGGWPTVALAMGDIKSLGLQPTTSIILVQDEGDNDNSEVTPAEVEKYVAVYRAMHRDRSLTVEQAAAQQGMTVAAFRALENRVQRDDAALQHARDELQDSAIHASPAALPTANRSKQR
jgi:hypothetical protein